MYYTAQYHSPLGEITLAASETDLVGLWFDGQKYFGASVPGPLSPRAELPVFGAVRLWLDDYFAGRRPDPARIPLSPIGSDFRRLVWRLLLDIPYGTVTTYGDIAREAARRLKKETNYSQAVGSAVGHNPISILIPCHRVVGKGGSLTGYAGGIPRKIALLEHEGADLSGLSVPRWGTAL